MSQGWRGLYCSSGGWVAARDALASVARSLRSYGVKTAFGTSGTFSSLLLSPDGSCAGVRCVDGTEWSADLVVFAAGAWSPGLIDLEGQCESKCWVYAHVQLSPDEAERMRAAPTVYNDKLVSRRGGTDTDSSSASTRVRTKVQVLVKRRDCFSPRVLSRPCPMTHVSASMATRHHASASPTPPYLTTVLRLDTRGVAHLAASLNLA